MIYYTSIACETADGTHLSSDMENSPKRQGTPADPLDCKSGGTCRLKSYILHQMQGRTLLCESSVGLPHR